LEGGKKNPEEGAPRERRFKLDEYIVEKKKTEIQMGNSRREGISHTRGLKPIGFRAKVNEEGEMETGWVEVLVCKVGTEGEKKEFARVGSRGGRGRKDTG